MKKTQITLLGIFISCSVFGQTRYSENEHIENMNTGVYYQGGPGSYNDTMGWQYPYGTKLTVNGGIARNFEIVSLEKNNKGFAIRQFNQTTDNWTNWKNLVLADSSGNVDIGVNDADISTKTTTYGSKLNFLGANSNTDPLWMARYNVTASPNASELRVNIGDDINHFGDKFNVGVENSGVWHSRFVVQGDGNVGIGTTSPTEALEINGNVNIGLYNNTDTDTRITTYGSKLNFLGAHSNTDVLWMARYNVSASPNASELRVNIGDDINHFGDKFNVGVENSGVWHSRFVVQGDGNVGIGTTTPDSKLTVAGKIHAQEIKVTIDAGADFVFADDYDLLELKDLEAYLQENKHLPEIAPAATMETEGLELGKMNIKLLQKVEELTLYTIAQEKKIEAQDKVNIELMDRLVKLETLMKKIN